MCTQRKGDLLLRRRWCRLGLPRHVLLHIPVRVCVLQLAQPVHAVLDEELRRRVVDRVRVLGAALKRCALVLHKVARLRVTLRRELRRDVRPRHRRLVRLLVVMPIELARHPGQRGLDRRLGGPRRDAVMELLLGWAAGGDDFSLVRLRRDKLKLAMDFRGGEVGVAVAFTRGMRHLAAHHPRLVEMGSRFASRKEVAMAATENAATTQHSDAQSYT